jgi:hypothetical protein
VSADYPALSDCIDDVVLIDDVPRRSPSAALDPIAHASDAHDASTDRFSNRRPHQPGAHSSAVMRTSFSVSSMSIWRQPNPSCIRDVVSRAESRGHCMFLLKSTGFRCG